jgi:ribonuclease R
VGEAFDGKVSGIARFGIFVKLDETGADGLVPMRELGREFFNYDADRGVLIGSETRREINLGLRVKVKLAEAAPVTGGIVLELLELDGRAVDKGRGNGPRGRGKPPKRAQAKAKIKGDKTKRKIERKRK